MGEYSYSHFFPAEEMQIFKRIFPMRLRGRMGGVLRSEKMDRWMVTSLIGNVKVGMMVLLFGYFRDLLHEFHCLMKIMESKFAG